MKTMYYRFPKFPLSASIFTLLRTSTGSWVQRTPSIAPANASSEWVQSLSGATARNDMLHEILFFEALQKS